MVDSVSTVYTLDQSLVIVWEVYFVSLLLEMNMSQGDLYGKTYDQQLRIAGDAIADEDISPNRRITGEIVFEPMGNGVRVTARDDQHRVLWGYIGSKETVSNIHCLVATYDTLQGLIAEELDKRGLFTLDEPEDPVGQTQAALDRLEATIKWLRASLDVKKVSDATLERAKAIARIATDADRQISLDANSLKGMKSRTE